MSVEWRYYERDHAMTDEELVELYNKKPGVSRRVQEFVAGALLLGAAVAVWYFFWRAV